MAFSIDAINALKQRLIKPYAKIETKLSSDDPSDPWHEITYFAGRLLHDSREFTSELTFRAIDKNSKAVDQFRNDSAPDNYLRTGSQIRLLLGITFTKDSEEINEYRTAFRGFITKINPFVENGFWGAEVTAHDKFMRSNQAVASIRKYASIKSVENEILVSSDNVIFRGVHSDWIENMVVIRRTRSGEARQVSSSEYQVLSNTGGVEFFETQQQTDQISADYFYYDSTSLNVSEIIKLALEYPSESGGLGLSSSDYEIVDTSRSNPDPDQQLPLLRFSWDEISGGPIEIYNNLLNSGSIPENLKFWYDSEDDKWRLQFVYQKDPDNPKTPGVEPDFDVIRSLSFDDPADSEELYTRVLVVGRHHAPENLAQEGEVHEYELPPHPGWTASFKTPTEIEGASNNPRNITDSSLNTQYMWILGDKVGENTADGAIVAGTETTAVPEFTPDHPYNEIAPIYVDLGEVVKPSRVVIHLGSNRFGMDRNPGRPPMLVSIQVAESLTDPDDMHDPGWIPLSDCSYRVFSNANDLFDLSNRDFLIEQFRYIRVLFHFGLYYKWKPERRFIEYPIREIAVYEDDKIVGTSQVSLSRYPSLYDRYQKRGFRTYIHNDETLQTQDEVDNRASELLDELVQSYLDRETVVAWDPRFRLHAPSVSVNGSVYGLTVRETDPRYGVTTSRLITRIEYDLDNFIVRISGTDYFNEVE